MTAPRWSVVIPALNEGARLPPYLHRIVTYFEGRSEPYEVVVVDDGSTDDTIDVVQRCIKEHPAVRAVALGRHQGKGAAVRQGMLSSSGDFRLFTDADGATPIEEVNRFEPAVAAGADIVIGSRAVHDPSVAVVASPHRVAAGRAFNWMVSRLGLDGVSDTQCGFKLFVGHVADDLFGRLRTAGLGFDVELLLLARAAGYRIAEVPVNWTNQPGGKVGVLRHGLGMTLEIVKARWRLRVSR